MKRLTFLAIAATLFAFGCKKEDVVKPDRGRSYVHILGALEADTFNITIDYYNSNDVVINDFYHHRNFPMQGYADLEAGGTPDEFGNGKMYVTLSSQPFANLAPDTVMTPKTLVLERDARSTICFVDSFGTKTIVKYDDVLPTADATNSQVRFINLRSQIASASLTSTDAAANIGGVNFLSASAFGPVAAGFHTFEVKDGSGNVLTSATVNVSPYTTYTFYVSGTSGPQLNYFAH